MTAPARLLTVVLAAVAALAPQSLAAESVVPPTLTGCTAAVEPPLVSTLLPRSLRPPTESEPRKSEFQATEPVIRGQSPPGWNPAAPVGPAYGSPGGSGAPGGYGAPLAPLGPEFAPPQYQETFGVNGPQPYDFAPELYLDAGHIFEASAEGRPQGLAVSEIDARYEVDSPGPLGGVVTVTPEYRLRLLDGPGANVAAGQSPLPGSLHRLGVDFAVMTPKVAGFAATAGFTPSVNTDFEDSLTDAGRQYDGRAALFYDLAPDLTLVGGVKYYDRLDDLLLPWAGAVWRPGDRWEIRAVFPEPRVEYFYGPVWGKPMWIYAEGQFRREAWQFSPDEPSLPGTDTVQFTDLRLIVGARKEQGWGRTFLEAGLVFDREVEFRETSAGDFDVGDALILRGGVRF